MSDAWYVLDGTAFVPIPPDDVDAYNLYRHDPRFNSAVQIHADRSDRNADELLRSGPNCIQIDAAHFGVLEEETSDGA